MKKIMIGGLTAGTVSASLAASAPPATEPDAAPRPNIVLILADDMGFSDLGCTGGEIRTPNLDRLAAEGMLFTRFYNMARCCPTRASLLTGLYPHQAGMGWLTSDPRPQPRKPAYQGFLNESCVTLAEVLGGAGYYTMMSGKWHVGDAPEHWPDQRGFRRSFSFIGGSGSYFDMAGSSQPRPLVLDGEKLPPGAQKKYLTDEITDYAAAFLDERPKDRPFFLYLAYTAPHYPLHALEEDIAKYEELYLQGWDDLRAARHQRQQEMNLFGETYNLSPREERIVPWANEQDKKALARRMAVYAAQVDRMDQQIGRILEKLDETGQRDNTLILFLSDNGAESQGGIHGFDQMKNGVPPGGPESWMSYGASWANLCNTPFRYYKGYVNEGGLRTPLIVNWPKGLTAKGICHSTGSVLDFMPTFCELAGAEYPQTVNGRAVAPVEGRSLVPFFRGGNRADEPLCWEHEHNKAVRSGRWKLVQSNEDETRWALYDIENDPTEMLDLSAKHPAVVEELKACYAEWAQRVGVDPGYMPPWMESRRKNKL